MFFLSIPIVFALVLSIVGSLTFWVPTVWYEFYKPLVLLIGGFLAGLVFVMLFIFISGAIVNKKNHTKVNKYARFLLTQGLQVTRMFTRVKPIWIGLEKIPKNERFVLVANHKANFDSLCISEKLYKYDIAFISKMANSKLPIGIPKFLKAILYLFIERDDIMQSLNVMKTATSYITENKCSIGVFPEGQRNPDILLGDFHEGVFNIALHSGAPIVVMSIKGSQNIKKNFPKKKTYVKYEVLTVLTKEDLIGATAKATSDKCRELILNSLSEQ